MDNVGPGAGGRLAVRGAPGRVGMERGKGSFQQNHWKSMRPGDRDSEIAGVASVGARTLKPGINES